MSLQSPSHFVIDDQSSDESAGTSTCVWGRDRSDGRMNHSPESNTRVTSLFPLLLLPRQPSTFLGAGCSMTTTMAMTTITTTATTSVLLLHAYVVGRTSYVVRRASCIMRRPMMVDDIIVLCARCRWPNSREFGIDSG